MNFKITKHKFIQEEKPNVDIIEEALMLRWDYRGHTYHNGYSLREWIQTLQTKINESANWLYSNMGIDLFEINTITSSVTGIMLFEEMPMFSFDPNTYNQNGYLGILGGRYMVVLDRDVQDDHIYVGTQEHPRLCKIFIDNLGI
jgi:hypothetical protein